jgi:hypothetical protein
MEYVIIKSDTLIKNAVENLMEASKEKGYADLDVVLDVLGRLNSKDPDQIRSVFTDGYTSMLLTAGAMEELEMLNELASKKGTELPSLLVSIPGKVKWVIQEEFWVGPNDLRY